MRVLPPFRRAAQLGATLVAAALAGCDVARFATDPKPILEETWNFPATSTSISVAELLPASVSIYSTPASTPPDSSAFLVNVNNVTFTRRLGDVCAQCQTLNGTTAVKPAFVLTAGSATGLPPNVVSATLAGGTITYSIVNALSFDPIRVRALSDPTQGFLVVVIKSGTAIVGRDSINGATTAFPAGTTLTRSINLAPNVISGFSVDLTVDSPQGDHTEFIDANGTLQTTATIGNVRVGSVTINVPNKTVSNPPQTVDLSSFGSNVVAATFEMTILNPWAVSGALSVGFASPTATITKSLVVPAGSTPPVAQVRSVSLDSTDLSRLVRQKVNVTLNGSMTGTQPVVVTPKQTIAIDNRIILKIRTGGSK